ncbi:ATP-grasp domain-containing protein [Ureibacillus suwonensis]|uniref:ATP-grasp domain-containing protein n=1 Tax=Ureibacillus suwonensis TaxID=313007 RepID=A0ABW0R701_9BACL
MWFFTEASGSLTSHYLIKAIKEANHKVIATDIDENCYAKRLADKFFLLPKADDPNLWKVIDDVLYKARVDIVIPSLDETLYEWSLKKVTYKEKNINIIISDSDVIKTFQDKWLTYLFFKDNNIPTPKTSLDQEYPLIKPRLGRGSKGIFKATEKVEMKGNISQEIIYGTEYTIDVFCDYKHNPIYIVPRKRLNVKEGKSTAGIVVKHEKIENYVRKMCEATKFIGPINIQCFELENGEIKFIEVNPRIAGGMALGFAATENWIPLIISNLINGEKIQPVKIKYGLKMMRYYSEVFTY